MRLWSPGGPRGAARGDSCHEVNIPRRSDRFRVAAARLSVQAHRDDPRSGIETRISDRVQFELEKNVEVAQQEVQQKINLLLPELPKGIDPPVVRGQVGTAEPLRPVDSRAGTQRHVEAIGVLGMDLVEHPPSFGPRRLPPRDLGRILDGLAAFAVSHRPPVRGVGLDEPRQSDRYEVASRAQPRC